MQRFKCCNYYYELICDGDQKPHYRVYEYVHDNYYYLGSIKTLMLDSTKKLILVHEYTNRKHVLTGVYLLTDSLEEIDVPRYIFGAKQKVILNELKP